MVIYLLHIHAKNHIILNPNTSIAKKNRVLTILLFDNYSYIDRVNLRVKLEKLFFRLASISKNFPILNKWYPANTTSQQKSEKFDAQLVIEIENALDVD